MALSREDWAEAALARLVELGPRGVAVEPIAEELGATKGSFYWHFRTREELLVAALERWEAQQTDRVIAETGAATRDDPAASLRTLLLTALGDPAGARTEQRLAAMAADAHVRAAVERVTAKRLAHLADLLRAAGLPAAAARRRARLAYACYLGLAALDAAAPARRTRAAVVADVEDVLAAVLRP